MPAIGKLATLALSALMLAGCRLVEVGTTNRTTLDDFAAAVTKKTRLILEVSQSNFRQAGFVGRPFVVGLREFDDVDPVRSERSADRRRGCRLAGGQLERQDDTDLLGHGSGSLLPS